MHIYRSFYKGTRLLCGGGGGGRGVRNRVTFSLIFVSIFDRNDFEIISKLERIDKNSSFFNEEMANGKREKKKNSTIKLIFRSKLFNQAIYLSFYNVDRAFRVHFIPTRCKEGSGNILKYQLVFNGTGQSFEIFAAFVSRIKGRYRFIQSFLICTRAHHSRETIPFLINETRVKASVQLNGSPLRPTPLNFIPGPKYEGKIDTFCPSCLRSSLRSSFTTSLLRSWIRDAAEIKWLKLEDNSPQLSRLSFSPPCNEKRRERYKIYNNDRINKIYLLFDVYGSPIRSIISFSRIVESVH